MIRRRRLIWHIFPPFFIIIVVAVAALTVYAASAMEHFFLDQTARELKDRAHLVAPQIQRHLEPLDAEAVHRAVKATGRPADTRITVILPSGVVVGDSEKNPSTMDNHATRAEVATALAGRPGQSIRYSKTLRKRMMYVAMPLTRNDRILAVLRTSVPISAIDDALARIQSRIVISGILIALFAAAISLVVSRRITQPIDDIRQGAMRLGDGRLEEPLAIPDSEEMAELARAMNRMALEIQARIDSEVAQRNEIEAILASMIEGVIAVDMEERIISINQTAKTILASSLAEFQGRTFQEAVRNTAFQALLSATLKTGENAEDDITIFTDDERLVHTRCSALRDAADRQIGVLVVMNDVTQLRRLESMRRDFAANVSHEIKTPLTAIKGFVETLRHHPPEDPEETLRFLDIIEKHVNRLAAIIEDLMQLSKIEQDSATQEIATQDCRVADIINTALQLCGDTAAARDVQFDVTCDPDLRISVDKPLMEQAVVNLLDNAVKYSPAGTHVDIAAASSRDVITISIKDHGPGIAKKHLPRLFERFYRVDKARSRQLGGTGLGLAIVKHIVQAHGGHISVDSQPGRGSTFAMHLPASDGQTPSIRH